MSLIQFDLTLYFSRQIEIWKRFVDARLANLIQRSLTSANITKSNTYNRP